MGQGNSNLNYSKPVSTKVAGESAIYRSPLTQNNLYDYPEPGVTTMKDAFLKAAEKYKDQPLLFQKDLEKNVFIGKTYAEVKEIATAVGSGILNMDLAPEVNEYNNIKLRTVGIFAKNRQEWLMLDICNFLYGFTMVPLYETLGPENISYCINHSGIHNIFAQQSTVNTLLLQQDLGHLKYIIALDKVTEEQTNLAKQRGLTLLTFQEVCDNGRQNIREYAQYNEDQIVTFSYTSGTTGNPKGAMLTHRNFVSSAALFKFNTTTLNITTDDVYLSYLPLPHIFDRVVCLSFLTLGAKIYFISGEIQKVLLEDIQAVKPTVFISVPRLYNRFYEKIHSNFDKITGLKKFLINQAIKTKLQNLQKGPSYTHTLWDKLVFNKIKTMFGGRMRLMITGSAPISKEVQDFFRIAIQCPFVQGYGPTECTAANFVQYNEDSNTECVGGPLGGIEFKVVDVPDMEYTSEDKNQQGQVCPRGEVCMRGNQVFLGYYKDPENTAAAIDKDGFLHTGDIGRINQNGSLSIVDRKKNIFKLSQGEYVAPEKIENVYVRSKGVTEVFVYGDSLQSYLIAIVVPDRVYIEKELAVQLGLQQKSFEELCQDEQVKKAIAKNMEKEAVDSKLFGFEKAQKIYLEKDSFAKYNCVTATFKLQRHLAKKAFYPIIEQLYKN